jgi:DNA-binding transcriptional regulator LsrR (DeoR family)
MAQKSVSNDRLVIKCCKLYYEEDYTQNEISSLLKISRPTISRMLKEARDFGIVKIEIVDKNKSTFADLERKIERYFSLKEVIIVEDERNYLLERKKTGKAAAIYLQRIIKNGDMISVSLGYTIKETVDSLEESVKKHNLTFLPLVGGVGQSNTEIHSNEILKNLSAKLGGNFRLLHAPAVVNNMSTKIELLREKTIKDILDYAELSNISLVGIGAAIDMESTIMSTGYFSKADMELLAEQGIVGDICLQFYDIEGNFAQVDQNKRVIGVNLNVLKKIDTVIGVACGEKKVKAIIGALNGGLIDVLVTNYSAAAAINQYCLSK